MSSPFETWPVEKLEECFPWITWREPMPVSTDSASGLGCRVCIARVGLGGRDVGKLSQTPEEFAAHWKNEHRDSVTDKTHGPGAE